MLFPESNIGGWSRYKVYQNASLDALAMTLEPTFIRKRGQEVFNIPENTILPCPGCGARTPVYQNGKIICSYCKGGLSPKTKPEVNEGLVRAGINRQYFQYNKLKQDVCDHSKCINHKFVNGNTLKMCIMCNKRF